MGEVFTDGLSDRSSILLISRLGAGSERLTRSFFIIRERLAAGKGD